MNNTFAHAVAAMGHVAREKESSCIQAAAIADMYGISEDYLLKVMQQLVRVGILRSKRGPRGGYSLARPANKISLLDVMCAVGNPVQPDLGLPGTDSYCKKAAGAYGTARDAMLKMLGKTTIASLIS
jgi:Rrf2 family protein